LPLATNSKTAAASYSNGSPGEKSVGVLDVLIVGAGFSGLGMAINFWKPAQLHSCHREADDIGGTCMSTNIRMRLRYPSHLYSFSFDRNPEWSRMYARREEIQDYLKSCVQRYGLAPYIA